MRTLIFNSTNLVNTTNKNIYRYIFPNGARFNKGEQIALASLVIPYSWYNISAALSNNTLQIIYNNITTNIVIPDGFYTITTLNSFIKSISLNTTNNLPYSLTATGLVVFYYELIQNTTYYSIQLNSYPAILPAGDTNPKGAIFTGLTPLIKINTKLSELIGLLPNINYPTTPQNTIFSIYSAQQNLIPNFSGDANSIIIECNIVENSLASSSKILYNFSIVDTTYGKNIVVSPSSFSFIDILESNYQYIEIVFKDSLFNNLQIKDPNLSIQLIIKGVNE